MNSTNNSRAAAFLVEIAFDTGYHNWDFGNLPLDTIYKRFGITPVVARPHQKKIEIAKTILNRETGDLTPAQEQRTGGSLMDVYAANNYSLRETNKVTNIPFGELRKRLIQESRSSCRFLVRGFDWKVGKQKRRKFELFEWIKAAHKHFSLKVFCETINWSPKAVLDLCAVCNEAGYPVIPPKITGAQLAWLEPYMMGEVDYGNAMKNKPIQPRRGGKQLFKRLLHQENPGRGRVNLPGKSRKKRNALGGKRGLVQSRGGKVFKAKNVWSGVSSAQKAAIQKFLSY